MDTRLTNQDYLQPHNSGSTLRERVYAHHAKNIMTGAYQQPASGDITVTETHTLTIRSSQPKTTPVFSAESDGTISGADCRQPDFGVYLLLGILIMVAIAALSSIFGELITLIDKHRVGAFIVLAPIICWALMATMKRGR